MRVVREVQVWSLRLFATLPTKFINPLASKMGQSIALLRLLNGATSDASNALADLGGP